MLIVGGGPDLQNNQVAIESNVRYVGSCCRRIRFDTLFADGNANHASVLYDETLPKTSAGERKSST